MNVEISDLNTTIHGSVSDEEWYVMVKSLADCRELVRQHRYVVEVGTLCGKTTLGIMRILDALEIPCCVSTIDKEISAMVRWGSTAKAFENKSKYSRTEFFHGESHDILTRCWPKERKMAWAFVDGCHCEDCVAQDITAIDASLALGGQICFHDADNQRTLGMLVHERYHADGISRPYGVTEAILNSGIIRNGYSRRASVPPTPRPEGPTPIRGGLQVWEKVADVEGEKS